jgi:hypothetical protein
MKIKFSLFVLGIVILLSACSTENPTNPNPTITNCIGPQPKFQYKVNGNLRVKNAMFDPRLGWRYDVSDDAQFDPPPRLVKKTAINNTQSTLYCWVSNDVLELKFTNIINDSGTYSNNHWGEFIDSSISIVGNYNHTVKITRYSNGTVDGNFTATITDGTITANITEGQFSNIPIINL